MTTNVFVLFLAKALPICNWKADPCDPQTYFQCWDTQVFVFHCNANLAWYEPGKYCNHQTKRGIADKQPYKPSDIDETKHISDIPTRRRYLDITVGKNLGHGQPVVQRQIYKANDDEHQTFKTQKVSGNASSRKKARRTRTFIANDDREWATTNTQNETNKNRKLDRNVKGKGYRKTLFDAASLEMLLRLV